MTPERYQRITRVLRQRQTDLTVLMEQVNKEHNFSAILRTCDAVGAADAHVVPPEGTKLRIHRHSSSGAGKWMDVKTHRDVASAAADLKERDFVLVAAHLTEDALDYRDLDFRRPTALMVGAELDGISPEGLEFADHTIVIPMRGMVQSLNVSVATAVVLYEALRQRESDNEFEPRRLAEEEFQRRAFEWGYPRLAAKLRQDGRPYPALGEDGSIVP